MKTKKIFSTVNLVMSIILYALALLSAIYAIAQIKYCYDDVAQALAGGMTVSGNVYTIFDYYMQTCSPSLFWGALLVAAGWLMMQKSFERPEDNKQMSGTEIVDNEPSTIIGVYDNGDPTENPYDGNPTEDPRDGNPTENPYDNKES